MPYTTLVAGTVITASWANASVRDQVVTPFATAAARTSAVTAPVEGMVSYLADSNTLNVYDGSNWIAYGRPHTATVATSQGTTSGSFTDLATTGPAVTVTTGTAALVGVGAYCSSSVSTEQAIMGYAVSGATTTAAADATAYRNAGTTITAATSFSEAVLTAGSNVFTAKYRSSSGTATFADRRIIVIPM